MHLRRRMISLLTVAASATGLLLAASPASASVGQPTGVWLRGVGTNSISVSASHAAGATSYRLYASTVRADLYAYNINAYRSTRHVAISTSPTLAIGLLPASNAPYYYRVAAAGGGSVRLSEAIGSTYLRPATPTGFAAHSSSLGYALSWHSGPATGYLIYQSADPTMSTGVRIWRLTAPTSQFTPYGLTVGTPYYFSMRALNGTVGSSFTGRVVLTPLTDGQQVRVVSYNLLVRSSDGQMEGGQPVAPWDTQRGPAAAALIRNAAAQVIAVQEGGATEYGGGPRQVDSLVGMLGSNWTVAVTEQLRTTATAHRLITGNYIVYRNDLFIAVGTGGNYYTAGEYGGAYQMLKSRSTGALFLVVSLHLHVGQQYADDRARLTQMGMIVAAARKYAWARGTRAIIYAGDTNSLYARWHLYDTPGIIAFNSYIASAINVAAIKGDTSYNSFNGNQRVAPRNLGSIDRVFADPGVSLMSWSLLMRIDGSGRFVGPIPSDHNGLLSVAVVPYQKYNS